MKKICITIVCFVSIFLLMSCDKFLELKPRDQKIVKTIEDYRDIMASYMNWLKNPAAAPEVFGVAYCYPYFDIAKNLGIYTGETNINQESGIYYDQSQGTYTTDGKKVLTWMVTEPYCWNQYYSFIGPINLIISGVQTAEGTNEEIRNYVLGEALVWRAFAYFKLLQYYSPYQNNEYGIPVHLDPVTDVGNAMPDRNTQKEVFTQLLKDCNQALDLLKQTPSSNWNCAYRQDFIHAMMASIYTWKAMSGAAEDSDWKNAEACATKAMNGHILTNSPEVLRTMFNCKDFTLSGPDEYYFRIAGAANTYSFNFVSAYYKAMAATSLADGKSNPMYYRLFQDNDIRKDCYFTGNGTLSDKYNLMGSSGNGGCLMLFRLAEMYLVKAEALIRQNRPDEAREVLKTFKENRYTGNFNLPADKNALLQEILDERTREFYMENDFRWLDMKRLGIRVERILGGEKYILESDDFRYTFPIPANELQLNKNIKQNPGWENVILN